jgi:hypothetical protein
MATWFLVLLRNISFIQGNINILLTLLIVLKRIFHICMLNSPGLYCHGLSMAGPSNHGRV